MDPKGYEKLAELGAGGSKISVWKHSKSGRIFFRTEKHYRYNGEWRMSYMFDRADLKELGEVIEQALEYEEPAPEADNLDLEQYSNTELLLLYYRLEKTIIGRGKDEFEDGVRGIAEKQNKAMEG